MLAQSYVPEDYKHSVTTMRSRTMSSWKWQPLPRDPTEFPLQRVQRSVKWQTLVQVFQGWRRIILLSPHRLDPHLSRTYGTPVRQNQVYWTVISPLTVNYPGLLCPVYGFNPAPGGEDNIVAALRRLVVYTTSRFFNDVLTEK